MKGFIFNLRVNIREVKSFLKFSYKIALINWKYKTSFKTFKLRLIWF